MIDLPHRKPARYFFCTASLAATVFLYPASAAAKQQHGPLGPLIECAELSDDTARLACYDERIANLRDGVRAGNIAAVDRRDVEAIERDGFGFNLPSLPRLSLSLFSGSGASDSTEEGRVERGLETAAGTNDVEVVERGDDGQVERVLMTIARVDTVGASRHRFTMENGQVWVQIEDARVTGARRLAGAQAEIRRAAMGSYLLRINSQGQAYRVNRAQ